MSVFQYSLFLLLDPDRSDPFNRADKPFILGFFYRSVSSSFTDFHFFGNPPDGDFSPTDKESIYFKICSCFVANRFTFIL